MRALQGFDLVETLFNILSSNQVVGVSSPSGRAIVSRSIPDTWVTVYTGDIGNTFAWKGLSMLSSLHVS